MWIEDVNGELVNLDHCRDIKVRNYFVEAIFSNPVQSVITPVLFESDDPAECQAYMKQLKKELAAFGKLIKVELNTFQEVD